MKFSSIRKFTLNESAFEKSSYSEIFGYSGNLKLKKSGADMKKALTKLKEKEEARKLSLYEKMVDLMSECDSQPTEKMSSYVGNGMIDQVETVPKLFKHEFLYEKDSYPQSPSALTIDSSQQSSPDDEQKRKKMREYNDTAHDYVRKCVDILKLQTTINNLEDKAKYELTVDQASLLGF